jgi:hypothetical protein
MPTNGALSCVYFFGGSTFQSPFVFSCILLWFAALVGAEKQIDRMVPRFTLQPGRRADDGVNKLWLLKASIYACHRLGNLSRSSELRVVG